MAARILFDGRASLGFARSGSTYVNGIDLFQVNQEVANASAIGIAHDPLGAHGNVWRFTVDRALDYSEAQDKARAELSPPNSGVNDPGTPRDNSDVYMAKGVDLWFFWRFMLAPDFRYADDATQYTGDAVLIQIHDKPGTSDRVAPIHLILINDILELRNSYSTTVNYDRLLWRQRASAGVWYSCVLNARWDDTAAPSEGYMHWWVNRRKAFVETSALNTYATDNSPGPWPKCSGLYYPHGLPSNFTQNTVYHTGLQVGTEYSSFDEFMAACGSSDTELEGFVTRGVSL